MNLKQSLEKHDFHGVWMRLLALAMILIVAVSALIASPVSANATEVGDPSAVKGKTYAVGTDTTFAWPQLSSGHGARGHAAGHCDRHAVDHQPAGHYDQGFLAAAGHRLR